MRALLLGLLLAPGCAWRTQLVSEPPGATVTLPSGERVITPETVKLRYVPVAGPQWVTVTYPGMRTLEVNLRRSSMPPFGLRVLFDPVFAPKVVYGNRPRSTVRFVMVQEHGAAGTWDATEELE